MSFDNWFIIDEKNVCGYRATLGIAKK